MPLDPEVAEVLRRVRDEVLTGPEKWTQGASARRADGDECASTSYGAVSFCLIGAINRSAGGGHKTEAHKAVRYLKSLVKADRLAIWNDVKSRQFEHVRSLLDRALGEGA